MLKVVDKDNMKFLELEDGEEIIITCKDSKSYMSVYCKEDILVFDSTLTRNNYKVPYDEREKISVERHQRLKEKRHQAYLEKKKNVI